MFNVYDGTLGMLVDTNKITNSITNYIINNPEPLNYEIKELEGITIVAILGKNDDEKRIPMFQHPLIFKDSRNDNIIIALDFRLYTKKKLDDVLNIIDVLNDKYNGGILIQRGIFSQYLIKEETQFLLGINNNIAYGFSNFIVGILTTLVYDKSILDSVFVASMIHYYNMDVNKGDIKEIINRLPVGEIKRLMHGDLKEVYNRLIHLTEKEEYDLTNDGLTTLLSNIHILSDNDRLKGVNEDMFISACSRGFYSINSKELAIAFVENKASILTMVYSVLTEGINSKSILKTVINNTKHVTVPKDIIHNLSTLIDESTDII